MRLSIILYIGVALLLVGCGATEQGSPGSWGSAQTNTALSVWVTPSSTEVDVCSGASDTAVANIIAAKIKAALPDNTLYLEQYTLTFTAITAGAPPLGGLTVPDTSTLPIASLGLRLIDTATKDAFINDVTFGGYSPAIDKPLYIAKYTLSGRDMYGSGFGTVVSVMFNMGQYSTCALSMSPSSLSLTGIFNPDLDASDDITFYITGGIGNYTVYSDNGGVIAAPGALGNAVASFVVDPDAVGTDTVVKITAEDGVGSTVVSTVTVTP